MRHPKGKYRMMLWNLTFLVCLAVTTVAQPVPSPKEHFGFNIGDDYCLASYTQTEAYFRKLDESSGRVICENIGETEEGRREVMLVISSPQNLRELSRFREISQKMGRAEIAEEEARKLSLEGRAVVWIDGGLHGTEVVGSHQLIETAWQLASRQDPETIEILDKVIVLLVHANPDGQELVSNWYMRESQPEKRSFSNLPRLYQKYAGHDNNRDFYIFNLKETRNMGRQMYIEWLPQIIYNHHQSGPAGTVLAGPPYRDPFNYAINPLVMTTLDALGAAMQNRLISEGKSGFTQREGSVYSTWYNGGLRTSGYFHNMTGILTEIIGHPNPMEIPLVPGRLVPDGNLPYPVMPQKWHFRQSIDYSVSLNYAVMKYAARHSDELLFNFYRMGRNSIEKGSRDTWSITPKMVDKLNAAIKRDHEKEDSKSRDKVPEKIPVKYLDSVIKTAGNRDPYGYILPSDQPDFPTAVKFANALIQSGIVVLEATEPFSVNETRYPAGSLAIKTAQAFRPHIIDMFEPQDHPNDFRYEGGPPIPPYDVAGWTLAYLMNIKFDRIMSDFSVPAGDPKPGVPIRLPAAILPGAKVYQLPGMVNNSFLAVNLLLKEGIDVYRDSLNGDFYLVAKGKNKEKLKEAAAVAGITVNGIDRLTGTSARISPSRLALWDSSGGSISSGWIRWILENFSFPFSVIRPKDIESGNLTEKYDVIVFPSGAIPSSSASGSLKKSVPELRKFLEAGGRIVTIGSSANLARHLEVPVKNALTEISNGEEKDLSRQKYFIPGSILRVKLARDLPANRGMEAYADVFFNNNPVFRITSDGMAGRKVEPLMWFDMETPLRSGWAWGQIFLKDGIAAFQTKIGKGELVVFGPEITFRAQSHGTFKLLFNQLYQ